jgi:hypothetical protein
MGRGREGWGGIDSDGEAWRAIGRDRERWDMGRELRDRHKLTLDI